MRETKFNRRKILGFAAAGLSAPALMRASRVEAAEVAKMAGQLLVCGFPGSATGNKSTKALAAHLKSGRAGGALFLRHNVKGGPAVTGLSAMFVNADRSALLAIDQEGGKVQRLGKKHGLTPIPTAQWVARNKSVDEARTIYAHAGRELRAAGFNFNMAPSVDIHEPNNPVIGKYGRSFGTDVERIAAYAAAFVDGFSSARVACSLKHFPGHGSSRGDSHDGFVDITTTWTQPELVPFQKLAARAPLIMSGHLFHTEFSEGREPITFSRKAIAQILRGQLNYQGVIITDDLDMGAIRKKFSLKEALILALRAGNDLALMSNSLSYDENLPANAVQWVTQAVKDGRLKQDAITTSYNRVMRLKSSVKA